MSKQEMADRITALEAVLTGLIRFCMVKHGFHSDNPEIDAALIVMQGPHVGP